MKILIACEHSGTVRDAFVNRGHDAMSCDLLKSDKPGNHYQGDVRDILYEHWDMIIAHPDCTYLTNAGSQWLFQEAGRFEKLEIACAFFNLFLDHPCSKVVVENPIPHIYALSRLRRKYNQIVKPSHHGHMESKRTCLWLKGVQPLVITNNVEAEMRKLPYAERNKMHYASDKDRWKIRSKTFDGIAEAMASQWR